MRGLTRDRPSFSRSIFFHPTASFHERRLFARTDPTDTQDHNNAGVGPLRESDEMVTGFLGKWQSLLNNLRSALNFRTVSRGDTHTGILMRLSKAYVV
jgi:hypothetical protein